MKFNKWDFYNHPDFFLLRKCLKDGSFEHFTQFSGWPVTAHVDQTKLRKIPASEAAKRLVATGLKRPDAIAKLYERTR